LRKKNPEILNIEKKKMSKIYLKQLQELTISHHNNKLARIYLTTD